MRRPPKTFAHTGRPSAHHGRRQGGTTYHNSTQVSPLLHSSMDILPHHLSSTQRACTQAPMFEPLLQALDTRNGRAHHESKKMLGKKDDATWTQTRAMASNQSLPFPASFITPPPPPLSLMFSSTARSPFIPLTFHSSPLSFSKLRACRKETSDQEKVGQRPEKCKCDLTGATIEFSMLKCSCNHTGAEKKFEIRAKWKAFKRRNARTMNMHGQCQSIL